MHRTTLCQTFFLEASLLCDARFDPSIKGSEWQKQCVHLEGMLQKEFHLPDTDMCDNASQACCSILNAMC